MTWHIELGNHADSAVPRILNHAANLRLRVVEPIGTPLLQKRKHLALGAESLVLRKMPMKNIQLDRFHPIQIAFNYRDGHEVSAGIDHQPAPWKARLVINGGGRYGETLWCDSDELQECL